MIMLFTPILANSGLPFTMVMLALPLRVWLATFGLGGLGIVLLEAWGLHQRESVPWRQALSISLRSCIQVVDWYFCFFPM